MVKVTGHPIHKSTTLEYDGRYTKESTDEKYQISFRLPEKIVANNDTNIVSSISDVAYKPVTVLEPL
jgi:hypothetical protein